MPRLNKRTQAIDAQIGRRIRETRHAQGMSQTMLADQLGITFQQVQKYENGSNRVSAARLFEITHVLGMPITYFYEDAEPFVRSAQRRKRKNRVAQSPADRC